MPEPVETTTPDGIDYGWVMQMTFITTIVVGAPIVAIASTAVELPTWNDRVQFAIGVGGPVWFVTSILVYLYAKRNQA